MNAFLGLFLSAIQYSLLAGENGCSLTGGRAASAELLGGISFVASVYMLLYGVVFSLSPFWFRRSGCSSSRRRCRIWLSPLLIRKRTGVCTAVVRRQQALGADRAEVFILCATVWRIGRARRISKTPSSARRQKFQTALPYVTVVVVVSVVVRAVSATGTKHGRSPGSERSLVLATVLAALLVA